MTMLHLKLLPLILLSLLPLLPGQGASKAEADAAIKEFESFYKDRNEFVRKAAVEGLIGVDHQDVTRRLIEVLGDKSKVVREAAIIALGTQKNMLGASELVQRVWKGRKDEERIAILKAFETSQPDNAFNIIIELLDEKNWLLRLAAIQCLTTYGDREGATTGAILPLAEDKEPLIRLAVMQAFEKLGNPHSYRPALKALEDSDWRIQAAAIKLCVRGRWKAAIQPLINILKQEEGRLQDDATTALQEITDRDAVGNPDKWQAWWDRVKDGYRVPTLKEIKERKRRESEHRVGYDRPRESDYPPYHGIKTRSRRLLFVLDVSSSMAEHVVLPRRDRKALEHFNERYGHLNSTIKIDIAREELINMVAGLKSYAKFNIVTFNSDVKRWQKKMVKASGGNRSKAIKYLARLTPTGLASSGPGRGATNTFEALNASFGLFKGDEFDKKTFKTDADTVFFLSDGQPSVGRITQPQELLDYFLTVNKRAELVFHTISFGASNRALMEAIANSSGGQAVRIGL